ncbi:MAG: type II secretion system protein [bacterium]
MKGFFRQRGVSLLELLVAGVILIMVALFVSSIFLQGSMNIVTSWEETTALSCMQELLEEVRGVSREYYRFIKVATLTTNPTSHHHINIPTLVQSGVPINYTVVAHDSSHNRTSNPDGEAVTVIWEQRRGEGIVTCDFTPITLTNGIYSGVVTFSSNSSKPCRGVLHITSPSIGTSSEAAGIIVYPQAGEKIIEGELNGTRTAMFELFDDPEDNNPDDILPGDYMKGTITFTWESRKGRGGNKKSIVTIIAPFPE